MWFARVDSGIWARKLYLQKALQDWQGMKNFLDTIHRFTCSLPKFILPNAQSGNPAATAAAKDGCMKGNGLEDG
jgi:hypothetical protein